MEKELISAKEAAKKLGYHLKIVVSTKYFDNYNPFFNIYDEFEKPCRRIVVLTPYEDLEEVDDYTPGEPIKENTLIDGNLWLMEYPLLTAPSKIDLDAIYIPKEIIENI